MKPRNEALHADIDRIASLKIEIERYKAIAEKHHVSVEYVRQLVSTAIRQKRTNVMIPVEHHECDLTFVR